MVVAEENTFSFFFLFFMTDELRNSRLLGVFGYG